ncbi:hypothetical protein TNCV_3642161 [Trichonephila clavipes]|nr:hypothetical protein TNCV_3642161 [Trichonephila clavipes]
MVKPNTGCTTTSKCGQLQWRVGLPPAIIHAAPQSQIELIEHTLFCSEADGPTNLEQPTLNHVQSDTMASAVLADPHVVYREQIGELAGHGRV